jgi:hypothetical protein
VVEREIGKAVGGYPGGVLCTQCRSTGYNSAQTQFLRQYDVVGDWLKSGTRTGAFWKGGQSASVIRQKKKPGDSENRTFSEANHKLHFFRKPFSLLTYTLFQLTIALMVLPKMAPPPLPLPFPRTFILRLTLFHDSSRPSTGNNKC